MRNLPDPGPLSPSVPIPAAEPPDAMELIALPTGVNNRVAAYAYRGGSVFDKRDFYIGAALIRHPRGDLLIDAGFGRDIAGQFATMPRYFRAVTRYRLWKPAADQLEAAGYDFGRLKAILLTHAHWDHMSGLPDFPALPVMVTAEDKAFFHRRPAPDGGLSSITRKANVAGPARHYPSSAGSERRFGLASMVALDLALSTPTSDERLRDRPSCPTWGRPTSAPGSSERRSGLGHGVVPGLALPSQTSHAHLPGRPCCPACAHPTRIHLTSHSPRDGDASTRTG